RGRVPSESPVLFCFDRRMAYQVVLDRGVISDWCAGTLGSRPSRDLFESGYSSVVLGVELADHRHVVVKVRPWQGRLAACADVHDALFRSGFPCPEPLTGIARLGPWAVSAEAVVEEYGQLEPAGDSAQRFAEALAWFVRAAPQAHEDALSPSPPWTDWQGAQREELWPPPDDRHGDLNVVAKTWIDAAAAAVREFLLTVRDPVVVGHLDWYSANLGWRSRRLVAVFDLDSVGAQP